MTYPSPLSSSASIVPPLVSLSLNTSTKQWPISTHGYPLSGPRFCPSPSCCTAHNEWHLTPSGEYHSRWSSIPAWQSYASANAIVSTNSPSSLSTFSTQLLSSTKPDPYIPHLPGARTTFLGTTSTTNSDPSGLVLPLSLCMPELESFAVPPSPSDTCSSVASFSDVSPSPVPTEQQPTHVVCNAPLIAPKPLPYHSPSFLKFDLPDVDEDLSHPPYIRPSALAKRKRADCDEDGGVGPGDEDVQRVKRRAGSGGSKELYQSTSSHQDSRHHPYLQRRHMHPASTQHARHTIHATTPISHTLSMSSRYHHHHDQR